MQNGSKDSVAFVFLKVGIGHIGAWSNFVEPPGVAQYFRVVEADAHLDASGERADAMALDVPEISVIFTMHHRSPLPESGW